MNTDSSDASVVCGPSANFENAVPCQEFSSAQAARPPLVDYLDRYNQRVPIPDTDPVRYVQIRHGEYGYFGPCQDGAYRGRSDFDVRPCDPGYFDVGRCAYDCNGACPLHEATLSNCSMGTMSSRRFCQRLQRDFQTVRNGTTLSICCNLSRNAGREYDCPYDVYLGSPACKNSGRDSLIEQCLVGIPVPGQPNIPPDVLGPDCHLLWHQGTGVDPTRSLYIEKMLQACQGNNITHPACVNLMREDPDNTQILRDYLTKFCAENVGNADYLNMCACFYPDSFYQRLRKSLAEFYQIPDEYLNVGGRACIYRPCNESPIKHDYSEQPCDPMSVSVCTQSISLTTDGVLKDAEFKQDCNFNRNVTCATECIAPKTCVNGACVDKEACVADAQCGTLYECKNGRCTKKAEGMKWYFKFLIGLLVTAAVVGLIFGIRKIIKARKSPPIVQNA